MGKTNSFMIGLEKSIFLFVMILFLIGKVDSPKFKKNYFIFWTLFSILYY